MALDYLSVPPTSTAVERIFFQGCRLLQYMKNHLSLASIRAYLCLSDWCRNGLVSINKLVAAVKDKKRKCAASEVVDVEEDMPALEKAGASSIDSCVTPPPCNKPAGG
jgi:hypothetical protein